MRSLRAGLSAFALASVSTLPLAQAQDAAGDWSTYGHDKGGQRHSPLDQITPANVGRLAPAWTYHLRPEQAVEVTPDAATRAQAVAEGVAPARRRNRFGASQVTPLVIGGRMFITTPYSRVVALDPDTGKELWVATIPGPGQPSQRGLEYWPGDKDHAARVVFGTRDGRLIALDAATGAFVPGFGIGGVVEMKTPEVLNGTDGAFYGMTSPPIVFGNLIITGSAVQEFPALGAAGDVRAWDAVTGKLVWTFHSVPRPGEPNYGTWAAGSAKNRSGVNAWGFLTVDAARGIVYMPFAAPSWDRFGGDRKGDNLYSSSLVAADARTGKYLWHFQVVRHDIWDNDLQAPPILFDAEVDGRKVPAVGIVSKNALLFVLDRVTGKPVFPIADRKVKASDTPGEFASPAQPFPAVTPPLGRTGFVMADLAQLTPEHTAACKAFIAESKLVPGGLYEPVRFKVPTISFPGTLGGANWGGAAVDPGRHLLIVNTMDFGQVTELVPSTGALPVERGPVSGRFQAPGPRLPCQAPPWGQLSAVDTRSGKIAWQVKLGVTDGLPEGKRDTGRPNIGGAITTASGLTFIGATDDARFRAFATADGKLLWETRLDAAAHSTPITYAGKDGRQFVAVSASGGSFLESPMTGDTITAYALPKERK
ncbi:MAG: pyrroloquinoline quinone-dependent dehydrogenase [Novosphingobium sp.]